MKKNLCLLFTIQLLILSFSQNILPQVLVESNEFSINKTENISAEKLKRFQKKEFYPQEKIDDLSDPLLAQINFDDLNIVTNNSIEIAPNRYVGVSFYHPNFSTWLSRAYSYSPPNSLAVGYRVVGYTEIFSPDIMVIEFTRPSKDVAFLWGHDFYYDIGQIDIYGENNQFITTVPLNLGGFFWYGVSLNQYSQRIKKLVLRRPPVSNNQGVAHILIDNFQFTPITTVSPVGVFESVNIQQGAAVGWSADPDSPSNSNYVDCYIDGAFASRVLANLSGASPYPGNHRFSLPIPIQYRDSNNHQINCYGLDLLGGDPPTLLTGSPKTFKFNAPIGYLDLVTTDGDAVGWSQDPDLPNESNTVHFYLNAPAGSPGSVFIGETVARLYRVDVGNHGFSFSIPAQYRDNQNHTIYAYGLDLTGDNSKPLGGNPKIFQLSPVVQTTEFVELPNNPLTINPNDGGGLRIFSERATPTGPVNNKVQVKAKISAATAGIPIYFYAYDLDEPSTDLQPIDTNGTNTGRDNRSFSQIGDLCPTGSSGCEFVAEAGAFKVLTDGNGEATIPFRTTEGHPGDNFAIIATTNPAEPNQIVVDGISLQNSVTGRTLQIGTDRTHMLTVWRKLHIEIDSMGIVQYNDANGNVIQAVTVGTDSVEIQVQGFLDPGRFQNGRMLVNGNTLYVDNNTNNSITAHTLSGTVLIPNRAIFVLYDDDDFNGDNSINGFDADNGEDVEAHGDSLALLQENDDQDCSDGNCNVFAAAYIRPELMWAIPYNTSDISFVQNVTSTNADIVEEQIDRGRYQNSDENDDFWVVYAQIAYQGSTHLDCDSNDTENCVGGTTVGSILDVDSVRQESEVPRGSQGSLIFIEVVKDAHSPRNNMRSKVVPHEIGHQFGLRGDDRTLGYFGLMGYSNGLTFIDEHLNIIRWRRKSPGIPRN